MEDYTLDEVSNESNNPDTDIESITASSTPSLQNMNSTGPKRVRRTGKRKINEIWGYCRIPDLGEPSRERTRRIWYCKYPECSRYSCLSTNGAEGHMKTVHGVIMSLNEPTKAAKRRSQDLLSIWNPQELRDKENKKANEVQALTTAANLSTVRRALLRLIILHDLPFNLVEWPQLHTFVHAINHCAAKTVFKSRSHVRRYIHENYMLLQAALKNELQQARSVIHLGTDTWHAPNRHELQGITAHFVDQHGKLQKALLAVSELFTGHGGSKVAPKLLDVLEQYDIKHKIGYLVGDNHGANDTLCRALSEEIDDFNAVEGRLRCFCHIANLAVQSFLYAKNDAAVDYADSLTAQSQLAINQQVEALQGGEATAGWINYSSACQKVIALCKTLRTSDSLYTAFKQLTSGKVIHAPNDTRWNSVEKTLRSARAVSGQYSQFVHEYPALAKYEMSIDDWKEVDETLQFLQPFKELTKRLEGDYVTLDCVQEAMDYLVTHYKQQRAKHQSNSALSHAIYTSWFAFDKWYQRLDETGVYAAAVLLNPNLRKGYLDSEWQRSWISSGIKRARDLWTARYANEEAPAIEEAQELTDFQVWQLNRLKKQRIGKANDEFSRFISTPPDNIKGSVLAWWQQTAQKEAYPRLYYMAINILSAPAASAEGERVFSHGRRVIPWSRASLSSDTIQETLCLKHWLSSSIVDQRQPLVVADSSLDNNIGQEDDESDENNDLEGL